MNITLSGTKITQDTRNLAFEKNNGVDEIVVTVDTDESWSYKLDVKYPDKYNTESNALYNIIDLDRNGNICSVTLTSGMLPFNGKYTMQLRGIKGDKVYHSDIFEAWVKYSIEPGSTYDPVPSEFYQVEARLDDKVNELKNGGANTGSGTGWDSTQITLLETIGNYLVFSDQNTGQLLFDNLITSLRGGSSSGGSESGGDSGGDSGGGSGNTETPTGYTITNSLVNVTTDNESTSIEANGSYTANLTADSGYYIDSVTVTMGGVNITDSAYANGVITITEVTGNIVIVASGAESDNLIVLSECTDGEKMPDGAMVTSGTLLVTPLLAVTPGATYKTNINRTLPDGTNTYSQKIYYYDDSQTYTSVRQLNSLGTINDITNKDVGESYYVRIMFNVQNTNPYFGLSGVIV